MRLTRWYRLRPERQEPSSALLGARCGLADDERSERVDLDARHNPKPVSMVDEVTDLRKLTQVPNIHVCAEAEGDPLLRFVHRAPRMPARRAPKRAAGRQLRAAPASLEALLPLAQPALACVRRRVPTARPRSSPARLARAPREVLARVHAGSPLSSPQRRTSRHVLGGRRPARSRQTVRSQASPSLL